MGSTFDPTTGMPTAPFGEGAVDIVAPTAGIPAKDASGGLLGDLQAIGGDLSSITALIGLISQIIPKAALVISDDLTAGLTDIYDAIAPHAEHAITLIKSGKLLSFTAWSDLSPTSGIFKEFIEDGLGVSTDKWDADAKQGVKTVDTMLTFAALMSLSGAAINLLGKPLLGGRWGDAASEVIGRFSETMGLSWAMGMVISELFSTAIGESIAEPIRNKKRPARLDWRVLRTMVKQHAIEGKPYRMALENIGFPDHLIDAVDKLADSLIPMGDLQQLYLYNLMDANTVEDHLGQQGYRPHDASLVRQLYIDKAQTAAGAALRGIARAQVTKHLISLPEYKAVLTATNFPDLEIDDDVAAIQKEWDLGRTGETVSLIKQQLEHGLIFARTARAQLIKLGISQEAADDYLKVWAAPTVHPLHGLSQSKILSYLASGVITTDQARTKLQALNVDGDDIALLIANPHNQTGVTTRRRSPGTVMQAYLDGVIEESDLAAAFTAAGVAADDLAYWEGIAKFRYAHHRKPTGASIGLSVGQVTEAVKYGIWTEPVGHDALVAMGYSSGDADVILEIAAKGPFGTPINPAFASVADAIAFLESLGSTVSAPPDPRIAAAEGMLSAAGYSYTPPTSTPTAIAPFPQPIPPSP